jgi:hypothetical protein
MPQPGARIAHTALQLWQVRLPLAACMIKLGAHTHLLLSQPKKLVLELL